MERSELTRQEGFASPLVPASDNTILPPCHPPQIASGDVFGKDQPVSLSLLGSERSRTALEGVAMELEDSLCPLLREVGIGGVSWWRADVWFQILSLPCRWLTNDPHSPDPDTVNQNFHRPAPQTNF